MLTRKRLFDIVIGLILLLLFIPLLIIISLIIKSTSEGPILYWSDRVGKKNKIYKMPKFRTMRVNTPEVATHLLADPHLYITTIGSILRKTSLDELPQLICLINGDMSLVGPRPALYNQNDLIELRTMKGVDQLVPGITGWAQVNGRDELSINDKVKFDVEYLSNNSFLFDLKILALTIIKVVSQDHVIY